MDFHRAQLGSLIAGLMLFTANPACAADLSPLEELGKQIFFDKNLSTPAGQACASCHSPETGFTGPDSDVNFKTGVYSGAAAEAYGSRKPPSAAYASFSPKREYNAKDETWIGGQFWDGRADDLVAQAKGPFLNPLEMNNASAAEVATKVRKSNYRDLFETVYGPKVDEVTADEAFHMIAQAIVAYESSSEVNSFSSKYDQYLAGRATLTPKEQRGLQLFAGKANCSACHPHQPGDDGSPPLFTDFSYDNVGAPRNPENPFYCSDADINPARHNYKDFGLGKLVKDQAELGKVKVPTLRNVARKPHPKFVKAYLHNGVFKSLKEVVHFYNLRDKTPDKFDPPDVKENVNHQELGNLGLTDAEENDLIAFLETLSDGYAPEAEFADAEPSPTPQPHSPPANSRPAHAPPSHPMPTKPVTIIPVKAEPEFPAIAPSIPTQDQFRGIRDVVRVQRFRSGFQEHAAQGTTIRRR